MGDNVAFAIAQVVKANVYPIEWRAKAPRPVAGYGFDADDPGNGRMYIIGGYEGTPVTKNLEFDPTSNTWTTKAAMTYARYYLTVTAAGGKLYAVGGADSGGYPLNFNEEYDHVANTWRSRAPSGFSSRNHAAANPGNGRLYRTGGRTSGGGIMAHNSEYNPSTDIWTAKATLPTFAERHASSGAGDGFLYIFCYSGYNLRYDPVADTYTNIAAPPTYRLDAKAVSLGGGRALLIGGQYNGVPFASIEEYNASTNTWTSRTPMPTARHSHAAAVSGGKVYVIGGWDNVSYLSVNEEYQMKTLAQVFAPLEGYLMAS